MIQPPLGMYETGAREPDFETLEKIADFFNVDMDFLLGRTDKTTFIPEAHKDYHISRDQAEDVKLEHLKIIADKLTANKIKLCESLTDSEVELFLRLKERMDKSKELTYELLDYVAKSEDSDLTTAIIILKRVYDLETNNNKLRAERNEYRSNRY